MQVPTGQKLNSSREVLQKELPVHRTATGTLLCLDKRNAPKIPRTAWLRSWRAFPSSLLSQGIRPDLMLELIAGSFHFKAHSQQDCKTASQIGKSPCRSGFGLLHGCLRPRPHHKGSGLPGFGATRWRLEVGMSADAVPAGRGVGLSARLLDTFSSQSVLSKSWP